MPSSPSIRRLGLQREGRGPRPLRAQAIVLAAVVVLLLAVPAYFLRRTATVEVAAPTASIALSAAAPVVAAAPVASVAPVTLAPAVYVKCGSSAKGRGAEGEACGRLPVAEEALASAIREQAPCAPVDREGGTINYVLRLDTKARVSAVFAGASGTWRGKRAQRAVTCVQQALPVFDWPALGAAQPFYLIAVLATYPGTGAIPGPPGAPTFGQ